MLEEEKHNIQMVHRTAITAIKESLFSKAEQQVDFSSDVTALKPLIVNALNDDGKGKLQVIKNKVLEAYKEVVAGMADQHLTRPQSEAIVTNTRQKLQEKLQLIKTTLFAALLGNINLDQKEEINQALQQSKLSSSLDKTSKQLCESLVGFAPSAINTYKAKLSLQQDQDQLKNKKTDAHLIAKVFDPESFTPDPIHPMDYDYKLNIDKLYLQFKHKLAHLKPGEKLHIEVEIPYRVDILKKVAETSFQYKLSLIALLLLLFIQFKLINKDDETRVVSAVKKLLEKDQIVLPAEDIIFSIKMRGNDGKLQTILKPRTLNPAVAAWKLNKPLQALNNILYSPANDNKKDKEDYEEETMRQKTPETPVPSMRR